MNDILREADLSAGAVYGYFRGKEEIIAGIAQTFIGPMTKLVEPMSTLEPPPPLPAAIDYLLGQVEEVAFGPDGFAYLAPQVWAEALHNKQIQELVQSNYQQILTAFTKLVRSQQRAGLVDPDTDPRMVAKVVMGSAFGYVLQRAVLGNIDRGDFRAGLAALTGAQPTETRPEIETTDACADGAS